MKRRDDNIYLLADRALCDRLQRFLDGELNPVDAENYRLHLSRCEVCAATMEEALQLEMLANLSGNELEVGLRELSTKPGPC